MTTNNQKCYYVTTLRSTSRTRRKALKIAGTNFKRYPASYEPLRIFENDDAACSIRVP